MRFRHSLRALLVLFTLVAVGCGGLIFASPFWAAAAFSTVFLVIVCAIVAAVVEHGANRAFWIGFAVLGGAYLYVSMSDGPNRQQSSRWDPMLVTTHVLIWTNGFVELIRPRGPVGQQGADTYIVKGFPPQAVYFPSNTVSFVRVGHSLFAIVLAVLGGVWGRWCYLRTVGRAAADHA